MAKTRKLTNKQEKELIEYYYANNCNKIDAGRKFAISENTVRTILSRHGRLDKKRKIIPKEIKAQICIEWASGTPAQEICRKYKLTYASVKNIVSVAGVKRNKQPKQRKVVEKDCLPQLCWKCAKATGKCSWSKNLTPVEGWTAKLVLRVNWDGEMGTNWAISKCPEFEKE